MSKNMELETNQEVYCKIQIRPFLVPLRTFRFGGTNFFPDDYNFILILNLSGDKQL